MTEKDLPALSIADLQSLLRRREVSAREAIGVLRERIEAVDGEIGAYLSLDIDAALKEADTANVDLPLGGVPLAIKDIISVMGQPCTCASKILGGIEQRTTPLLFKDCAPRAQSHLEKPTWTSLLWVRPPKTPH